MLGVRWICQRSQAARDETGIFFVCFCSPLRGRVALGTTGHVLVNGVLGTHGDVMTGFPVLDRQVFPRDNVAGFRAYEEA